MNTGLLHGILPTLGELLASEDSVIQLAAAEALRQFASGDCKCASDSNVQCQLESDLRACNCAGATNGFEGSASQ